MSTQQRMARQKSRMAGPEPSIPPEVTTAVVPTSSPPPTVGAPPGDNARPKKKRVWPLALGNNIRNAQVLIMFILGSLIIAMTLLIWFYASHHERTQVSKMALPLRNQLLLQTSARLVYMVESLHNTLMGIAVSLETDLIKPGRDPPPDMFNDEMQRAMWPAFKGSTFLRSVYFMRPDGRNNVLGRTVNAAYPTGIYSASRNDSNVRIWYMKGVNDTTGYAFGKMSLSPCLDFKKQLFFTGSINQSHLGVYFTKYIVHTSPVVSLSVRIKNNLGKTTSDGILLGTILVEELGRFMSALSLMGGIMYVMDTDGMILALPTGVQNYKMNTTTNTAVMVKATEVNNTVVAGSAKYLERRYGFEAISGKEIHLSNVYIAGRRRYVDTTFVQWKSFGAALVIVIPTKSIMGSVENGLRNLGILLGSLALGALVAAQVLALFVTRYMGREIRFKEELLKEKSAKDRAEACFNASRLFLANLSHDLRTPMSAILGILDIMEDSNLDTEQSHLIKQAQATSSTLHTLINSILDISKTQKGPLELEAAAMDISDELEHLVDVFSLEAMTTGVDVLLDLPRHIPQIMGDKTRVNQIFSHLLSTCAKYTKKGNSIMIRGRTYDVKDKKEGMRPRSSSNSSTGTPGRSTSDIIMAMLPKGRRSRQTSVCQTSPADQNWIAFSFEVESHGGEVSAEETARLCDIFAPETDGSAHNEKVVGLHMVRSLVHKMGGRISITEKSGCSLHFQFSLELPLATDDASKEKVETGAMYRGHALLAMSDWMHNSITASCLTAHGLNVHAEEEQSLESLPVSMHRYLAELPHSQDSSGVFQSTFDTVIPPTPSESCTRGVQQPKGEECSSHTSSSVSKPPSAPANESLPPVFIVLIDAGLVPEPQADFFTTARLGEFLETMQKAVPRPVGDDSSHLPKVSIAWAVLPSTSVDINRALRKSGCLTVQKPLVASRLSRLMATLSHNLSLPTSSPPQLLPSGPPRLIPSDSRKYPSLDMKLQPILHTLREVDEPPAPIPDQLTTSPPHPSHAPNPSPTNDGVPARLNILQPAVLPLDPEPAPQEGKAEPSAPLTIQSSASSRELVPAPGQENPAERKVEEGAAAVDDMKPLEGVGILLAEDTPIMAKVATILLKKMGAGVVWAADGRLAVESLASVHKCNGKEVSQDLLPQEDKQLGLTKFDLILMDCQMPNMDGYEATRIIRKMEARFGFHTPIVALTAHAMPQDRRKCLDAGMDEYLTKPINVPLLAKTVRSLLRPQRERTQASISQTGEEEKKQDKEEEKEEEKKEEDVSTH